MSILIEQNLEGIDLDWFILEGNMNVLFHQKGFPFDMRMKCEVLNANTIRVTMRKHAIAIFLIDRNELYRIDGSLTRQWRMVKNAFEKTFTGVVCY
jgi:hypothetical protein